MLVDRKSVAEGKDRVLDFLKTVFKEIFSPLLLFLLSFSLLFILLARGAIIGEQFQDTIGRWVIEVRDLLGELFAPPVLVLAGIVALISLIWLIIHYFLRTKVRTVEEAIHETIISSYFVFGAVGFYLWMEPAKLQAAPR